MSDTHTFYLMRPYPKSPLPSWYLRLASGQAITEALGWIKVRLALTAGQDPHLLDASGECPLDLMKAVHHPVHLAQKWEESARKGLDQWEEIFVNRNAGILPGRREVVEEVREAKNWPVIRERETLILRQWPGRPHWYPSLTSGTLCLHDKFDSLAEAEAWRDGHLPGVPIRQGALRIDVPYLYAREGD